MGYWDDSRVFPDWREVRVPSCFEAGCPHIDFYEGVCWYRRAFRVPADWQARRVVLRFEAVNYRAKVWLNGNLLGEHRDGFLPFEFDVGDTLRWDRENTVAVSVDNAHHEGDVPGMHVGWRGYGGIVREVSLRTLPAVQLERIRILAEPKGRGGDVEIRAQVCNSSPGAVDAFLDVTILDPEGNTRLKLRAPPTRVDAGAGVECHVQGCIDDVAAWSPSIPARYRAVARLSIDGHSADEVATPFGFRSIKARPDGLWLNGERIFLTGFNRHEDSPRTAMAVDHEMTRQDLEQMKEAGANFVRLCHYPHHPATLDLCDQLGLLVFCEIPLYFWSNSEDGRRTQAARTQSAARQLEKMIERDFNHPSVAFWSVSNETPEGEPGVAEDNRSLIRRARDLDSSRLCVHVMNRWEDGHARFDEDDVVCINTYPTMDFEARGHDGATFDIEGAVARQRARIDALHGQYPSKPILIAEFGYCSFAGTLGHAFGEDEHARSLKVEFASFDAPYLCGATIWCWADHPWPAGRFFQGLIISPFGVVSRDRRRSAPYWTARAMFRARQGLSLLPQPREPAGTMVIMTRAHLRDIPQASFPEGVGIRAMTTDDIGLWTDIQCDAEPHLAITSTLFRDAFGDDLEAIGWRCFIVTDSKGLGVGTISAWYDRDFRGQEVGRIHWLAVRPRCQGLGLAKAALTYAMNCLAELHRCCYLVTSGERIAAIKLYLDFGFEPDLTPANARGVWNEVRNRLAHPAITQAMKGARP